MKFSRSALALLAAVSLPAMAAVAQQAAQGGPGGPGAGMRGGPSPEMMARMQDGKLAGAKAMLRLTPEQEKLWAPVEEQIRAGYAERAKLRAEHLAKRAERQAQRSEGQGTDEGRGRDKTALPERLDKATAMMTKRAERLKAFSTAVKPLYASLSDEQKLVANGVLGQFASGGKGGRGEHGGWGGKHGRHHGGWGGMRAEGGEGGWGHKGGRGHHGGRHMQQGMGGMGGDTEPGSMGGMGGDKQ